MTPPTTAFAWIRSVRTQLVWCSETACPHSVTLMIGSMKKAFQSPLATASWYSLTVRLGESMSSKTTCPVDTSIASFTSSSRSICSEAAIAIMIPSRTSALENQARSATSKVKASQLWRTGGA